jgi:transcriptional regulator with XRE-family HTH domain
MSNEPLKTLAHHLRRLRTAQGRSLSDVARASGVGKATLHALEMGKGNPTIDTLNALATALGVPFGDLLEPADTDPVVVVRADQGTFVPGTGSDVRLMQRLHPTGGPAELYDIAFPPRSTRNAGAHGPGTREHVLLLQGQLDVGPVGRTVRLKARDLASFPGDQVHTYTAGPRGARAILVMQWASGGRPGAADEP